MISREELLVKLQLCVDDPMWPNHVEMPKRLLRTVIEELKRDAQCAPTWDEKTVEFAASTIVGSSINGADFDPDCCECPKCKADREEVREMVRKILALSAVTRLKEGGKP